MPERERCDRRHLRDEADALEPPALGIADVLRVRVERRERADGPEEHPHRMRVVPEPLEELLDVDVDVRVVAHLVLEGAQLLGCRQLAFEQEVRGLQERRILRELLDRVPPVAQDAAVTVDERDRAPARRGVQVRRVVRHQTAVPILDADLAQVGGTDRPVDDRQRVLPAGAVVDDGERILGHGCPFPRVVA